MHLAELSKTQKVENGCLTAVIVIFTILYCITEANIYLEEHLNKQNKNIWQYTGKYNAMYYIMHFRIL